MTNDYIKISPIPKDLIETAIDRAYTVGKLKNSITKGEGNISGTIGELLVQQYLGGTFTDVAPDIYAYDLRLDNGLKVEVKTKRVNTPPRPDYQCAISEFSLHQKCDVYVFVRVMNDLSKAWILGWIPQTQFQRTCKRHEKGEKQGDDFAFSCVTYDVDIDDLHNMNSLLNIARVKG